MDKVNETLKIFNIESVKEHPKEELLEIVAGIVESEIYEETKDGEVLDINKYVQDLLNYFWNEAITGLGNIWILAAISNNINVNEAIVFTLKYLNNSKG
jgi:hypothetical protein